jgi:DNA-binding transcriptional ArsR family regulator
MDATARTADDYRRHAELCKVLTDPKRLMLLDALRGGERSVGDLAVALGCSLPNTSQHLGVLRGAGLVAARRAGTVVFYALAEPDILQACDVVGRIVRRRVLGATGAPPGRVGGRSGGPGLPAPASR